MNWKQVCLVAQTFAAAKNCPYVARYPIITMYDEGPHSVLRQFLIPPQKLTVFPNSTKTSWLVRLAPTRLRPKLYFPAVCTPEALRRTLEKAWHTDDAGPAQPPALCTRSVERWDPSWDPAWDYRGYI